MPPWIVCRGLVRYGEQWPYPAGKDNKKMKCFLKGLCRLLMICLWFWSHLATAVQPASLLDYNREIWTTSDGLPHNTINNVNQDQDGYLYFASWEGVVRFDGRYFELFSQGQLAGLADSGILIIEKLASGEMLFGGSRGGLVKIGQGSARLLPKVSAAINDLLEDKEGHIWISTEGDGLFRLTPQGQLQHFRQELNISTFITHNLHQTSADRIWLGTADGLLWFNPLLPNPRFHRVEVFTDLNIAAIAENSEGQLLIGSERGVYIFENQQFNLLDPALAKIRVNKLLIDKDGAVWIGSFADGVFRHSALGLENLNVSNGLPNNKVYSLFQDRENSIWIGTNAGLTRLRISPFRNLTTQKGLVDNYVRTLLVHSDGSEWIGTTAGLNRIVAGKITRVEFTPALQVSSFRSLAEGPDGDVWVGTYVDGVIRLRQGKEIARYDRSHGLGSNTVMSILPQADGSVLLGTTGGLSLLTAGTVRTLHIADGLPGVFINSLKRAPDGKVWIGTGFGPATYDQGSLTAIPFGSAQGPQQIFDFFFENETPFVWMATDRGVVRYDQKRQQAQVINSSHGLPVEKFFSIQQEQGSDFSHFWLSSNKGVIRLLKSDLEAVMTGTQQKLQRIEHFGELEGMLNVQCNGGSMPSALRHPDGSFWFATAMGVAQLDPAQLSSFQPETPPVVVQKVLVDGLQTNQKTPDLAVGTRRIEFRYAGMSFLMPNRLIFRTRLLGFEQDWVERGNQYRAEYTNLAPGPYEFQVMATYPDTDWPEHFSTVSFSVRAGWWQHPGLWFGFFILLSLLIFLMYRWRTRQLLRNALHLQHQVQLQTRELQLQAEQLHSLVSEKSELVARLQQQTETLEQQVRLDVLTGIANRRAFDESLQYECLRSSRLQQPLSLVLIDLDHFKRVNDLYSHLAGDLVLKRVSTLLQQQVRDIDTLARWGGEEFALLLPNTSLAAAIEICERIRQQIAQIDCLDIDSSMRITASFGVANNSGQGQPRQLITQADAMLYLAKARGRDQVCG